MRNAFWPGVFVMGLAACRTKQPLTAAQMYPEPPNRLALASREPRSVAVVDGVSIAFHDSDPSGSRPAVVCLHAIGHGGGDFRAFEDAFAGEYRVITVDWPGQGASGQDVEPASAARYGRLFAGVVDHLRLVRFVVVGNSIGGAVGIAYAAAHPERVRGMILSDPGGLDPGGLLAAFFISRLERRFRAGAAGDPSFREWFDDYYSGILITPEAAAERRAIVASAYEIAPRLVEAWHSFRRPGADLRPLIPRVTMPVLFAWATDDRYVRWSRNRDAVERFPNRRVLQFKAGHSPFLETPAAFNAAAGEFLKTLP